MRPAPSPPARVVRPLISLDGVSGSALKTAARALKANGYRGAGISDWDASGIFGDLGGRRARRPVHRRRESCCCSTRPTSRFGCAGRSSRRSPRAASSSPRRTSRPRSHSDAPPGCREAGSESVRLRAAGRRSHDAIDASAARGYLEGFVEFGCQHVTGTRSGLSKERLMARTRSCLKTAFARKRH